MAKPPEFQDFPRFNHHTAYVGQGASNGLAGWRMRTQSTLLMLLLAATAWPVQAASASADLPAPDWKMEDGEGDVYVYDKQTTLTVPSNPANSHMDLLRVQIDGENEAGLWVTFLLKDFKAGMPGLFLFAGQDTLRLDFEIAGYPIEYSVLVTSINTLDAVSHVGYVTSFSEASLCLKRANGDCFYETLELLIDDEANTMRILLTKAALVGQGRQGFSFSCGFFGCGGFDFSKRPPVGTPTVLQPGDKLTKFHASYGSNSEFNPGWYDEAPNQGDGGEYVLRKTMANVKIAALLPEGFEQNVESGATTKFDVIVLNRATTRRIIELSHELEGSAENASKFRVTLPPSLTVPSGEARNLTVTLTTAAGASSLADVRLVLKGTSMGFSDETLHARLRLVPIVSLSPENPHLYFHSRNRELTGGPLDTPICTAFGCDSGWFNANPNDPRDEKVDITGNIAFFNDGLNSNRYFEVGSGMGSDRWYERVPLALRPITFGNDQAIQIDLKLKSDTPVDTELKVDLAATFSGSLIASGTQQVSVSSSGTLVSMSMLPASIDLTLPPEDTALSLRLTFVFQATSPHSMAGGNLPTGLRLVPAESGIRLPLVDPPESADRGTPNALMRLNPLGDRDAYVNPGEARLFNASMVNIGPDADVAHVTATVDLPGWIVQVLPGQDYRLGSGESVLFGLLVHAPPGAKEGDSAIIRVNATSDAAPNERGFLRFTAIATSGLDVADDSHAFKAHEDAQAKLIEAPSSKGSPGFEFVPLLAVLSLWVALVRRRKA